MLLLQPLRPCRGSGSLGRQLTQSKEKSLASLATAASYRLLLLIFVLRGYPHGGVRRPCLQYAAHCSTLLSVPKCYALSPCLPVPNPISTYGSILGKSDPRIAFPVSWV